MPAYKIRVEFSDGTRGIYDCAALLDHDGAEIADLKDPSYFARVAVSGGAPTWPNGFSIKPWVVQDELSAAGALEQ